MKNIKLLICVFLCSILFIEAKAQRLTFSSELGYFTNDENISIISKLWQDYIDAIDTDPDTSQYWYGKSTDIHKSLHTDGLINTFNIRKLTDEIYEINNIVYYPDGAIKGGLINAIYKVCAVLSEDKWLLTNYFDAVKGRYNSQSTDYIDFYIGNGATLDKKQINTSSKFAKRFIQNYDINNNHKITYITASSIDDCAAMIGLTYTPIRSHKPYAGRTIDNIVLSTRLDHIHEVVHAIMLPLYPNAPLFLHEGIATYYGGTAEQDFQALKMAATAFIKKQNIDFSTNNFLKASISDNIPLSYIVAASIVEYALQKGGEREVLRLFESKSYDEIFDLLGITKEQQGEFIHNLFIR